MKPLIVGIDPGASGGIAELWPDGKVSCFPMSDEADIRDYFSSLTYSDVVIAPTNCVVYLEQVGGYIGSPQPGSAMFKFGDGYGFIRGILTANRIKYHLVRPQTWQKGIPNVQGKKGADRKRALKNHAARLFPNTKITLSTADALLIANYGSTQPL